MAVILSALVMGTFFVVFISFLVYNLYLAVLDFLNGK
jgi:hypothetical protein